MLKRFLHFLQLLVYKLFIIIKLLKKIKMSTEEQIFFVSFKKDATFALRFEPPKVRSGKIETDNRKH